MTKKIIDCFTFYNELDLLLYRLEILYDVVDYFVIVEANHTFAGKNKPLYFKENEELFKKYINKIIRIVINLPYLVPNINYEKKEQWKNESQQRNAINLGIKNINLQPNDLIIISDLDEIPDPNTLIKLKHSVNNIQNGYSLIQDLYYYNLNTKCNIKWDKIKIVTYEYYKTRSPQMIRNTGTHILPILKYGGWHLSYFGDKKFIKNKLENFSHQEFNNNNYANLDYIENKLSNQQSLYNFVTCFKINISDNNYLPPKYDIYLTKYIL